MRSRSFGGTAKVLAQALLAAAALGLIAGMLWSVLAPDIQGEVRASGVSVTNGESRRQFGVDGWFTVIAAGGGLLLGSIGFARHRHQPVTALVVLAVAGLAAAAVQWWFGTFLGPESVTDRTAGLSPGSTISMPLELNSQAGLVVWSIAAVIGSLLVAAVLDDREPWRPGIRRRERSERSSRL
jgi:hypothetical protein